MFVFFNLIYCLRGAVRRKKSAASVTLLNVTSPHSGQTHPPTPLNADVTK